MLRDQVLFIAARALLGNLEHACLEEVVALGGLLPTRGTPLLHCLLFVVV